MTHDTYMNYMDNDTVEVGCHYCNWHLVGFEGDEQAEAAIEEHVGEVSDDEKEWWQ